MGNPSLGGDMSAKPNRRDIIGRLGEPPDGATSFFVDLYALGIDVRLDQRFVRVDVARDPEGEVKVSVCGPIGTWSASEERTVVRRRAKTPGWLRTVLEYVGVDEIVEGR